MQRKHTTTACQICRESKIKCDGVRPTCGSCKRKRKLCEYSSKDDKRKLSLRTAVEMLCGRVEQLTLLALKHNLEIPPLSAEDQALFEQVCATLEINPSSIFPEIQYQSALIPVQVPDDIQARDTLHELAPFDGDLTMSAIQNQNPTDAPWDASQNEDFDMQNWTEFFATESWDGSPSDWPWQILNDFSSAPVFPAHLDLPSVSRGMEVQNESSRSGSSSDDEVETDIVPRLAARFGSLRVAADGQLRYYGTASNYHFLTSFRHLESKIDFDDLSRAARTALENAQLDEEPPPALQSHLLDLFFRWHNLCHLTVDKKMFDIAQHQPPNEQRIYRSQSLINAMCAIGAAFEGRYHQSFITFPKPLADYFAARSKVFLEFEFDSPCVSTVQALLLLSSHEAAGGKDGRMWLYSGMAMRLSFDLGLHVDSSPYVKQGVLSVQEAEARRSTFWSCVVVNQLWSFSLGRPFRVDSEEITVARPANMPSIDSDGTWSSQRNEPITSTVDGRGHLENDSSSIVAGQWVALCEELAPLVRTLYGCIQISKAALQSLSYRATKRLEAWHETIPDSIKVHPGKISPPHVLLLHMAYHNFCILIHRPWTSKSSQPDTRIGPGHLHARGVCRNSASEIASLLRDYESHYGFRKMNVYVVNIIFSASLILIFGLIAEEIVGGREQDEKVSVAKDLNTCFRALDELGQSFESAKRNHEHLLAIQKHWSQRKRDANVGTKRRNQQQASSSNTSQKRIRPPLN